ncbi:hypothetical protein HY488_02000 [Candidatus Woesearchaeota archaeon]|nr:hypothetical protein [Candidatus Woesearchaeota archaeon]
MQKQKSSLDYNHYIEKQIKPIADAVLSFQNQSFEDILKNHKQRSLFEYH